jgi:mono/diheme cytochrome c family protein
MRRLQRRSRRPFTRVALLALLASASLAAQAMPKPRSSVLDGAYTSGQARRGQEQFERNCATCHGRELGGLLGPSLKGDRFIDQWREFPLEVLVNDMRKQMPQSSPGSLPASAYVDIAAYLLEVNGLPSGSQELTPEVAANVLFVAPGGSKPLPTSSPAIVAGCMTKDTGNGWFLTSASAPARTLNPYEFTDGELKTARETTLGVEVVRLQNLDALPESTQTVEALVGHKVAAKGILVLHEKGTRLNVAALNGISDSCEP